MGLFDSLGKAMKETAEKNRSVREATSSMSENELRDLYRRSKRRGDFLAMGNAKRSLKENYGYSDEDINDL